MHLSVEKIHANNVGDLVRLLQLEDRHVEKKGLEAYSQYYLMLNHQTPIAAMCYDTNKASSHSIIVHPYYPENTIKKAFRLLHRGIIQKEPL